MNPKARYALLAAAVAMLAAVGGILLADFAKQFDISATVEPTTSTARSVAQLSALALPDTNAVTQPLNQWRGKLLIINFWATWCAPCREEMPGFSRLQKKYAAKGIQFVGIAIDSVNKVKEFSLPTPLTYPLLIASPPVMQILAGLGNAAGGLPFTVVLGRDGSLRQSRLGIWNETALEATILTYLEGQSAHP
ncbi:MAG: TlpA disulfide reductase family protein [Sterolibacterium sp.]|nr:TlpA disulfide reductase family protein [Sterolibacterium sp.]